MSAQTMVDVIAEHQMENSPVIRGEGYTRCSCGFLSKWAFSRVAHNRHVAEALSAAGFGPVNRVRHDAYNSGYAAGRTDGMLFPPTRTWTKR